MRIAFDYQAFVLQSYGGISRYFARLAQGLSEMDQQVKVFAPLYRNRYLSALPQEMVNGRYISFYPAKTERIVFAYNRLRARIQIAGWNPDLVHETYYAKVGSAPQTCATVITVHDMVHELFSDEFSIREKTAAIKRVAIDRADHVICVSENTRMDLMRLYGTSPGKLSVVHLGCDPFAPAEGLRQSLRPSNRPFLLYVGNRDGYKNFSGLLKAVASSNRLIGDFDIVAFGGPKLSAHELRLISSLGFADNQVEHKSGSDELLGRLYGSARAFVFPSLYEGFGIPPLEAMAHQCPVISSNTSSMPEVIQGAGEYFDPNDIDDMRRAIEAVVYSDAQVACLRKSGAERLAAFSWKKCAQETCNIYKSLT